MNTDKKYQVIYADPPWKYDRSSYLLNKGGSFTLLPGMGRNHKKEKIYPQMSLQELKNLSVKFISDDNAICFMWTTDTHLTHAIELLEAWGFKYKTIGFVWLKETSKGNPVNLIAPWTNKCCEMCLLATKGVMHSYLQDKTISQLVKAQRTKHSEKPAVVAENIVKMFPQYNRIELFARDAKPGWDVWGNEIQNSIEL
jgi:site-specific DNA-methyltransferase (adenine-specific)